MVPAVRIGEAFPNRGHALSHGRRHDDDSRRARVRGWMGGEMSARRAQRRSCQPSAGYGEQQRESGGDLFLLFENQIHSGLRELRLQGAQSSGGQSIAIGRIACSWSGLSSHWGRGAACPRPWGQHRVAEAKQARRIGL
jgi:hypothetical protein